MLRAPVLRSLVALFALALSVAAGAVGYDRLVGDHVVFAVAEASLVTGADEQISVTCVRHPFGSESWHVERTTAGVVAGERGAGSWSAEIPSAGNLRSVEGSDGRFFVVELLREPVPCAPPEEEGLVTPEGEVAEWPDYWGPGARSPVTAASAGCTPPFATEHLANVSGAARPVRAPDEASLPPPGRTTCLFERDAGLRFCAVDAWAGVYERAVVGSRFVAVLRAASPIVTGRSLEDGRLLWRSTIPSSAGELWIEHVAEGALGLRANEEYFRLDLESGAITSVTPLGADVCNLEGRVVAVHEGVLSISREEPFALEVMARPGPAWRLERCDSGDGGALLVSLGVPESDFRAEAAERVADPMLPIEATGLAEYTFDAEGNLALAMVRG